MIRCSDSASFLSRCKALEIERVSLPKLKCDMVSLMYIFKENSFILQPTSSMVGNEHLLCTTGYETTGDLPQLKKRLTNTDSSSSHSSLAYLGTNLPCHPETHKQEAVWAAAAARAWPLACRARSVEDLAYLRLLI